MPNFLCFLYKPPLLLGVLSPAENVKIFPRNARRGCKKRPSLRPKTQKAANFAVFLTCLKSATYKTDYIRYVEEMDRESVLWDRKQPVSSIILACLVAQLNMLSLSFPYVKFVIPLCCVENFGWGSWIFRPVSSAFSPRRVEIL